MKLKDKVAIITGGGRGIGKAIAHLFAKEKAHIAIWDIDEALIESTASELKSQGVEILTLKVDVTDLQAVEEAAHKVLDKFSKIDILINNAGIVKDSLLVRMKESDWDRVIEVNLKGTFNATRTVASQMMKQRKGKIINIASIIGIIGNIGQSNYAASKAGIIGFTKSVARELAPRSINVNAIAPGFIQTEMTQTLSDEVKQQMLERIPLRSFGNTEDVAEVALFLASEDSNYITGQIIQVDGGMAM